MQKHITDHNVKHYINSLKAPGNIMNEGMWGQEDMLNKKTSGLDVTHELTKVVHNTCTRLGL